jgi:hypothetical protein
MMADPSKDLRGAASSARVLLSRSRSWPYDPWVLRVKAEMFIGLSQRLDGPSPSPAVRPPASECFLLTLALGDIGGASAWSRSVSGGGDALLGFAADEVRRVGWSVTHHAGIIWRAGPRTGPRPRSLRPVILLLCVTPRSRGPE